MDPFWWLGLEGGCWGPSWLQLWGVQVGSPKRAAFNSHQSYPIPKATPGICVTALGSVWQGPDLPCRGKHMGLCPSAETERDAPVLPGQAEACPLLVGTAGMMGRRLSTSSRAGHFSWSCASVSSLPATTFVLLLPQSWNETPQFSKTQFSNRTPRSCWCFPPMLQEHPKAALPG